MNCDFYIPDGFWWFYRLPTPPNHPIPRLTGVGPGVFCCPKILLRDDAVDIQGKVWHWHVWHEHTKSSSTHSDSDACMPTWNTGVAVSHHLLEEACISWSYPLNQFRQPVDFGKKTQNWVRFIAPKKISRGSNHPYANRIHVYGIFTNPFNHKNQPFMCR